MWYNVTRPFSRASTALKARDAFVSRPVHVSRFRLSSIRAPQSLISHTVHQFHTAAARPAELFSNTGKYDPKVPVRPDQFPILCGPPYVKPDGSWTWDNIQDLMEEVGVLEHIISLDDVLAMREMLRLVGPELFCWHDDIRGGGSPAMVNAARQGRVRILEVLLDSLDASTYEQRKDVKKNYDLEEKYDANTGTVWGTPLTAACLNAHVDVVRLLLARMPEVDINACDNYGYTPLQTVARHARRTIPRADRDRYGVSPAEAVAMDKESERRVEIVRLLLAHSAKKEAPDKGFARIGQTAKEAFDACQSTWTENGFPDLRVLVDRPRRIGNVLIQALVRPMGGDIRLTRMLIDDGGLDVHEGYFSPTATFDGRGDNGVADDVDDEETKLFIDAERRKTPSVLDVGREAAFAINCASIDTIRAEEKRVYGPGQGPDTYLTPLAAAALCRNAAGVAALLETPGADFYSDLRRPPCGRVDERVRVPHFREPELYRKTVLLDEAYGVDGRNEIRTRDRLSGASDEPLEHAVDPDTLRVTFDYNITSEAARKAYLDDCVATVQLLTADAAVRAATINATHPHDGMQYTPLQLGARFDRLPMLRVLLDAGADPRPPVPHTGRSVFFSVFASLLRLCSKTGGCNWHCDRMQRRLYHPEVIAIDTSIGTAGMTSLLRDLLWLDTGDAKDEAIRLARINEADADGNTALHWAMGYDLPHAQAALLALGARPDARNDAGGVPTQGTPPTTTRRNKRSRSLE
ncbi:uncharacterized protein SPSK_02272 [Sporothrix schenckii 1099-18]|uniref:Ankyrin repeat protein n=1 Tax=Sporothrix schenckii 1099-18 TaxID=1397361 RepID=A0A0F2MED6_SPOSC|nr:uncharacterized protein SPSK_02272 [Sporothrix schenckii 1099-18]KJR86516.1 hypothetical protein SPSK_02272 [Sporothrix schenckii 1099-18]